MLLLLLFCLFVFGVFFGHLVYADSRSLLGLTWINVWLTVNSKELGAVIYSLLLTPGLSAESRLQGVDLCHSLKNVCSLLT